MVILELDTVIESVMKKGNPSEGGEWICTKCYKKFKKKSHMQMHVEAFYIEGFSKPSPKILS